MKFLLDEKLIDLSESLSGDLYLVGGCVRDFLINGALSLDVDLAGTILCEDLIDRVKTLGGEKITFRKSTGSVAFSLNEIKYEYTRFRVDYYSTGGAHKPSRVEFTLDIEKDAKRRDFKCNAIYYHVKNEKFVDPLTALPDVKNRVLDTVIFPDEVFAFDGVRLLRLARFVGELGFTPTSEVLESATKRKENVLDLSKSVVFEQLIKILHADTAHPFSPKYGHYSALKTLDKTGVFDLILPDVALGRGMKQRKDYHDYDVLEHVFKTVKYADSKVRLSALLHDVGKPFAMQKDGKYKKHAEYGIEIAKKILVEFGANKRTVEEVLFSVKNHMIDINGELSKESVRKFIYHNFDKIDNLLKLKQADFSAGKDRLGKCPVVEKWENVIKEAEKLNIPKKIKELAISPRFLLLQGTKKENISEILEYLFDVVLENPALNEKDVLENMALRLIKSKSVDTREL